jgi:hypothetical protein
MLNCIYCNKPKFTLGKGSKEHAILSSLGGRKLSQNICCVDCNNRLGKSIDDGLSNNLSPISTLLNIKTGRNKKAPTQINAVKLGDESYNLLPTGEMLRNGVQKEFNKSEDVTSFRIIANNKEQALKVLEGQLKAKGKSLNDVKDGIITEVSQYGAQISHTFSLTENDLRSIAKMALTMLATKISPERLRDKAFVNVVNYINGNDKYADDIVFSDTNTEFPSEHKLSDINHRIFIYASQEENLCIALVELYGGFKFSVLLSREWCGPNLACCYVIDPITTEKLDYDICFNTNLNFILANRGCHQEKAIQQLKPLFDFITESDLKREEAKIISANLEKFNLVSIDSNCSEEVLKAIVTDLTQMYLKKSSSTRSKLV